ncbi:hypothetical protein CC78DRAFT_581481 [Lojkania enalia]|uniref:Uncharacterized protein n=1 Tax=Lojkania enalia TaxID=147567 RepID=A0A9P4K788_9PLEO|nr:hypothetical protein CC78DRAFT_581481 [Didymosphaeria enalia]
MMAGSSTTEKREEVVSANEWDIGSRRAEVGRDGCTAQQMTGNIGLWPRSLPALRHPSFTDTASLFPALEEMRNDASPRATSDELLKHAPRMSLISPAQCLLLGAVRSRPVPITPCRQHTDVARKRQKRTRTGQVSPGACRVCKTAKVRRPRELQHSVLLVFGKTAAISFAGGDIKVNSRTSRSTPPRLQRRTARPHLEMGHQVVIGGRLSPRRIGSWAHHAAGL